MQTEIFSDPKKKGLPQIRAAPKVKKEINDNP